MEKTLKNYTIIPPQLYVERNADRQLQNIIEDMGRPGYVLVSRQMGKTNLLLNAKRKMENSSTIFIYVDLSNQYDEARGCFRNIIDTAIQSNYDVFKQSLAEITSARLHNMPSNVEHQAELLILLREFNGKLIIVLDEIDALTSSNYSDQIFSQIRSTYFAGRTNHSELDRVTYILSGVAEPANIIKDKNKSPFNIGEKIYLDDFTYDEFVSFISKSRIKLTDEIVNKIYGMLSGHPRMTWDVCSKLEEIYLLNGHLSCDDLNEVIKRLYTQKYDHAPVDHIRDLVINNNEIRKAVKSIHKNTSLLTDSDKSLLYLSGIIKSNYTTGGNIVIKNQVIAACLSSEWLETVDAMSKGYITLAAECEMSGKYDDAIKYYKMSLDGADEHESTSRGVIYMAIAGCLRNIANYDEAIKYYALSNEEKQIKSSSHFGLNMFNIGLSQYKLGNYKEASDTFNSLGQNKKIDVGLKYRAMLNYASSLMHLDLVANTEAILNILQTTIESIVNADTDTSEYSEILTIAYYNIAKHNHITGNHVTAAQNYIKALDICDAKYKPYLYLCLLRTTSETNQVADILNVVIDIIEADNLKPRTNDANDEFSASILEYDQRALQEFTIIAIQNKLTHQQQFFRKNLRNSLDESVSETELIRQLLFASIEMSYIKATIELSTNLIDCLKINNNIDSYEGLLTYRTLAAAKYRAKQIFIDDMETYIKLFSDNNNYNVAVTRDDILMFVVSAMYYRSINKYNEVINVCTEILRHYEKCTDETKVDYTMIYYLIASAYDMKNNKILAVEFARKAIDNANKHRKNTSLPKTQNIDQIIVSSKSIIQSNTTFQPLHVNKIGRNEPCYCGSGLKYKKCHGK